MEQFAIKMKNLLQRLAHKVNIVGSLFRDSNTLNSDVDFLVSDENKDKVIKFLESIGTRIRGKKKVFSFYVKTPTNKTIYKIDIWFTPLKYYKTHLYELESSKYNLIRRKYRAKELGYTLNRYGLFLKNKLITSSVPKIKKILSI